MKDISHYPPHNDRPITTVIKLKCIVCYTKSSFISYFVIISATVVKRTIIIGIENTLIRSYYNEAFENYLNRRC